MKHLGFAVAFLCALIATDSYAQDKPWPGAGAPCSAFGAVSGTCVQGQDARLPTGNWPTTTVNGDFLSFNGTTGAPQESGYGPSSFVTPTTIDNDSLPISVTSATMSGQLTDTLNGAASTPAAIFDGTLYTGGTGSTTLPLVNINPGGGTSTAWGTNGTLLGLVCPSTSASAIEAHQGNALIFNLSCQSGAATFQNNLTVYGNVTLPNGGTLIYTRSTSYFSSPANYTFALGQSSAIASPQSYVLRIGDSASGTNISAGNGEIDLGVGTGTGALPTYKFRAPTSLQGSGTTAQTLATIWDWNATNAGAVTFSVPVDAATFNAGTQITIDGATAEGAGTINALTGYYADNTQGATCSGTPTSSFASIGGIVTHC